MTNPMISMFIFHPFEYITYTRMNLGNYGYRFFELDILNLGYKKIFRRNCRYLAILKCLLKV